MYIYISKFLRLFRRTDNCGTTVFLSTVRYRRVRAGRVRFVGQQLQVGRVLRRIRTAVRSVVTVPSGFQGSTRIQRIPDCQE